jgi:hypothetical protein
MYGRPIICLCFSPSYCLACRNLLTEATKTQKWLETCIHTAASLFITVFMCLAAFEVSHSSNIQQMALENDDFWSNCLYDYWQLNSLVDSVDLCSDSFEIVSEKVCCLLGDDELCSTNMTILSYLQQSSHDNVASLPFS